MISNDFSRNSFGFSCVISRSLNEDSIHSSKNTTDERSGANGLSRGDDREVVNDSKGDIEPRDVVADQGACTRPLDIPVLTFLTEVL